MATVAPTKSKLVIMRDGHTTTNLVPLPTIVIDTRERTPYLFERFPNWVSSTNVATLATGDYTIEGYEDRISLERKTLNDIVGSLTNGRERFLREMERLSKFDRACICIEASREDIKTPYSFSEGLKAFPNSIIGSLDAIMARYGNISVVYGNNRELAEEFAASWLNKCAAYNWLEDNGHGRVLRDGDL